MKKTKKIVNIVLSLLMIVGLLSAPVVGYAAAKPPATAITKISSVSSSAIKVSWKKAASINGYQVQLATDSKFKKNKKNVTISKGATVSKKITGLKAKKKYYVRIRSFSKNGDKKIYSSWSKAKTVTTKGTAKKSSKGSSSGKSAKRGTTVYITPTGEKYHYSADCAGKNAIKKSLSEVKGSYGPCKKCAS